MIRLACDDELGGFDEGCGSYCEDVDCYLRATDHGWDVEVVPDAVAWGLGAAAADVGRCIAVDTARLRAKRGGPRIVPGLVAEHLEQLARPASVWAGRGRQSAESRQRARRSAIEQLCNLAPVTGAGVDASLRAR